MPSRTAIFIGLLALPAAVSAQTATFTVADGRALMLGGETELGAGLNSANMSAAELVDIFDRLCRPDPAGAGSRAAATPFGLLANEVVLPAEGKQGEARIRLWASRTAVLTVWSGDETNFKGRAIVMPSRAAVTTGPYGPFKAQGVQCNLVVRVDGFASATTVADALTAKYGAAGKLVIKKTFADGYWRVGDMRVNLNVPTVRMGTQPLHLSAQIMPVKGAK